MIFAACRNPEKAEELQAMAKTDPRIHPMQLDVECDKSIKSAFTEVSKILENANLGLNLLINNAGIGERGEGVGMPNGQREAYLHCFNVNSVAPMLVCQTFLPLLKRAAQMDDKLEFGVHRAAIVNISSGLGSIGENNTGSKIVTNIAYRLSKTALNQLTKTMAIDLESDGILVMAFCPGLVKTDMAAARHDSRTYDSAITTDESTQAMILTILNLKKENSGAYMRRNGDIIPF